MRHLFFSGLLLMAVAGAVPMVPLGARVATAPRMSDEAVVRDFYRLVNDYRTVGEAFAKHVAPGYIEHSADVPGGTRQASMEFMERLLRTAPAGHVELLRAASDRGLVFLHARYDPGAGKRPVGIVEIFRLAGGKIVEHWDLIKETPAEPVNPISPF